VELPQGGTVVVQTVASETKTFSWDGPKVFRGYSLREITSSTAPVNTGTGKGPTQVVGFSAVQVVSPVGNGGDDVPRIRAAMNGGPVRLTKGGLYVFATTLELGSYDVIYMNGADVLVQVPPGDVTNAAMLCTMTDAGTVLTLAADTVAGARSFSVTATTDLVQWGRVILTDPTHNCLQTFLIQSISGAGPYTITVDRRIGYVFTVALTSVYTATVPTGIRIYGEGATLYADPQGAHVLVERGLELACAHDTIVESVNLSGPFGWGASFDTGSYHSRMSDIRVEGDPAHTLIGVASECNYDCTYEDITVLDVSANSAGGFYQYSGINCRYRGIHVQDSVIGFGSNQADVLPSSGCTLESSRFDRCGTGLIFADNSNDWWVSATRITNSTATGILVLTNLAGIARNLRFVACDVIASGNVGVLLNTGADIELVSCNVQGSALHGLDAAAAVSGLRVSGGMWSGNGGDLMRSATDIRVSDLSGANNVGGGIRISAAANAWISNTDIRKTTGSAGWQAYICNSTGAMRVVNSRVNANGATGNTSGFLTTAGVMWIQQCAIETCAFGLFRNGGGTLKYDETLVNGGTTVRTGGTLTTTGTNENSYG
jgi:hypothetical protein